MSEIILELRTEVHYTTTKDDDVPALKAKLESLVKEAIKTEAIVDGTDAEIVRHFTNVRVIKGPMW